MSAPYKSCGCGRTYDRKQWDRLPFVSEWRLPWGEVQELRNCVCGSTIAVVLDPGEADPEAAAVRYERVAAASAALNEMLSTEVV